MGRPSGSKSKSKRPEHGVAGTRSQSCYVAQCFADQIAAQGRGKVLKPSPVSIRRRSTRMKKEVPNTSDLDDVSDLSESSIQSLDSISDEDDVEAKQRAKKSRIEVSIPLKRSIASTRSSRSAGSSPPAESLIYDTPGTSAIATPAESIAKERVGARPQSSKRKRGAPFVISNNVKKQEQEDEDVEFAKALQAAEYGEGIQASDDDLSLPIQSTKVRKVSGVEVSWTPSTGPTRSSRTPRSARALVTNTVFDSDDDEEDDSDFAEDAYDAVIDSEEDEEDEDDLPPAANPDVAPNSNAVQNNARPQGRRQWRRGGNNTRENRMAKERAKLEKAHPEILTMWDDLSSIPKIDPVKAAQPAAITRKLKSFQLEGLDWMMKQEKTKWRGGLLGDEMGMGKTIQAVSLIMSDWPRKEPTLVVVPPVALMQWTNEIKEYTDGKLSVLIYHNTNPKIKGMTIKDLKKFDVIMISYSGLESIYRKESKGWKRDDGLIKENSKIHAIEYHRVILDEAHNIKTRTTGVAKACFAIKSHHKWCLSGTPVQNRIGEFFSLLRFLQIDPFACYFCKSCPCAKLHWSQTDEKKCDSCGHTGFQHVSIFNQELLNPICQQQDNELRKEAFGKLRLITDRIMLRRMKRDHTSSMELPPKEVIIHKEFFGEIERDFSSSIMSNTTRQFDTYVSRGVMLNNYANIFGLIMQMRQVANHPDLILKKHAEGGQNVLVCCICDETAEEPIRSRCHHEYCRKCAKDYVRSFDEATPDCPRCHIPLAIDFEQPDIEQDEDHVKKNSIINRIKMEDWTSSTKIEMLVYDLYKLRSAKQTHKSIVFSQFTSMLQLVEWRLRRAGFKTVMLDGSMSPSQRQKSIEHFMNNTDVEVFLVSLKAGGVALNLTEASRVFIIDP